MNSHPILESVTFRLRAGSDPSAFQDADEAAQAFLEATPGFLGRILAIDEDGTYLDLVRWTDRETALAAAEAYLASPAGQAMSALIDPDSLAMRHLGIARDAVTVAA